MALDAGILQRLTQGTAADAWSFIIERTLDIASRPLAEDNAPGEVVKREREIGELDLFLASSGWDLWRCFGQPETSGVERTSDRLARWWAEPSYGNSAARAVLILDALSLRDALIASNFDFHSALRKYAVAAGRVQLTRRTLSEELREAFLSHTDEAKLLNECIFAYWNNNPKGRAHSLALLSTLDSSILSMGAQFILVVLQAFRLLPGQFRQGKLGSWSLSMLKLAFKSLSIPQTAVRHWMREQQALAK